MTEPTISNGGHHADPDTGVPLPHLQTIQIPNPPRSKEDAIACLTAIGQALKTTMLTIEANPAWVNNAVRVLQSAHGDLDRGGYKLEDLFGVPDETFGAGGGGKGSGGSGGGG